MIVCKTQSTAPQPPKHQNTEYVQSSKEGRGDLGSLDRETDINTPDRMKLNWKVMHFKYKNGIMTISEHRHYMMRTELDTRGNCVISRVKEIYILI